MQKKLVTPSLVILSGLLLLFGGCKKDSASTPYGYTSAPPPAIQQNTVMMVNVSFSPTSLTVPKNTTVTWQNNDGITHTSTSDNGVWDTGDIAPGGTKTTTFATAGSYPFHCSHHPTMMLGTIIVQ